MVGLGRLELPTSRLSGVRSNLLSYGPVLGGDEENRTPDPLLARQVLSQLSYTPIYQGFVRNLGGENELVRFFLIHCFF